MAKQKKLALSIRGGGSQGSAYAGAVKAIQEEEIEVGMIIGASAGSLVGAALALDISMDKIMEVEEHLSIFKFFGWDSIREKSIISDDKAFEFCKNFYGDGNIEDTKIPLFIQVTNIKTGKEVILDKGPIYKAVLASSSMPPVIKPIEIDGNTYIDGGYSGAYNAQFLRDRGAEVVIGFTIDSDDMFNKEKVGIYDFIYMAVKSLHDLDLQYNPVDLLIDNLGDSTIGVFDFKKALNLYDRGYEITKQRMPEIKKLIYKKSLF